AGAAGQFLAHASQPTSVAKSNSLGLRSRRRPTGWIFKPITTPEGWRVAESAADAGTSGIAGEVPDTGPAAGTATVPSVPAGPADTARDANEHTGFGAVFAVVC